MTLGQRIRERRKELGLTQEQTASRAPVALRTLQRVEADSHRPNRATLDAIARVLKTTSSALLENGEAA